MLIRNPYDTTYGKMISIEKTAHELYKYYDNNKRVDLSYEVIGSNACKLVFITGYTREETELPVWDHPLFYKGILFVDMRKYLRLPPARDGISGIEKQERMEPMFRDQASCKFLVTSAITISQLATEDIAPYRPILGNINSSFGMLMGYCCDLIIKLNPVEKLSIEIAGAFYSGLQFVYTPDYNGYAQSIIGRIVNGKLSLKPDFKMVEKVVDGMLSTDLECNIGSFVRSLAKVIPQEKAELITEASLLTVLSNIWFGPGNTPTIIMSLECPGLYIPLLYSCLNDNTYKKTKLSTILNMYKRSLESDEIIKNLTVHYNTKTVQ